MPVPSLLHELSHSASVTSLPLSSLEGLGAAPLLCCSLYTLPLSLSSPPSIFCSPFPSGFFNFNEFIGMTNVAKANSTESQRLGMDFTVGRG